MNFVKCNLCLFHSYATVHRFCTCSINYSYATVHLISYVPYFIELKSQTIYYIDFWLKKVLPDPNSREFADIVYLKEQSFLIQMRDFFWISFTSFSSFFTHIETNQSVGGAKTGVPGGKTT